MPKKKLTKRAAKAINVTADNAKQLTEEKKETEQPNIGATEIIIIVAVLVFVGFLAYFFIIGFDTTKKESEEVKIITSAARGEIPTLTKNYTGTLPGKGNDSAQITLIEFSDFQCPYCNDFYSGTEQMIYAGYVKTGKVKFYYKDLPQTSMHDKAMLAAHAGRCANEQNKFWEMHDKLLGNQLDWGIIQENGAKLRIEKYALELGLNVTRFNECVKNETYKDEINTDMLDARRIGLSAPPSFMAYLPKNKMTILKLDVLKNNVAGITTFQDKDNYILVFVGTRSYREFKAIFDTIN